MTERVKDPPGLCAGTLQESTLPYLLMIVLQCAIYGLGNPITKIAFESVTPLWCLALRFTMATLVLAVFAGRKALKELRTAPVSAWLPCALCMAGAYIFCNIALNLTTATAVGFLMSLPVLFVPGLSVFVLRRPYRKAFLPVQLAAAAGLYLLCSSGGTFSFGWGETLGVLVAVCVAGALVWGEKSLKSLSPLTVSLTQLLVTALISVPGALLFERGTDLAAIRPAAWWVIVYLALLCSCLAYLLQNTALTHLPASIVSLLQCTEPVFTAAASFFLLGERLSGPGRWGAALLFVCILYGNYLELSGQKAAE